MSHRVLTILSETKFGKNLSENINRKDSTSSVFAKFFFDKYSRQPKTDVNLGFSTFCALVLSKNIVGQISDKVKKTFFKFEIRLTKIKKYSTNTNL